MFSQSCSGRKQDVDTDLDIVPYTQPTSLKIIYLIVRITYNKMLKSAVWFTYCLQLSLGMNIFKLARSGIH